MQTGPSSSRSLAFAAIAVFALTPVLAGQTPPPAKDPSPTPRTVVENVREVSVDLVIRDKQGRPVPNLKPEDIEIRDNGSPVKINSLVPVSDTSANSVVTLVFDQLDPGAAKGVRDAALEVIKMTSSSHVYFAVLKVDGRLRLLQEATTDREALRRAISSALGFTKSDVASEVLAAENALTTVAHSGSRSKDANTPGEKVNVEERARAQAMLACLQKSQDIVVSQHARPAIAGLLALAQEQEKLPGRKTVVYFSQGLQIDSTGRDLLSSIVRAANRSHVSYYAIDARALDEGATSALMATVAMGSITAAGHSSVAPAAGRPTGDTSPGSGSVAREQMGRISAADTSLNRVPLAELSESTGGFYIASAENLRKPLKKLMEDLAVYYEASFTPSDKSVDGTFHTLVVKPQRAGLTIRARTGYFNGVGGGGSAEMSFETPMRKALAETQPSSDVKFRSAVVRLGSTPSGNATSVVVEVPLNEVQIAPDPNARLYSIHVAILAQIKDKSGAVIEKFSEDVPRRGALEAQDAARSEVVTFQRHVIAGPGDYLLESAVMDRISGKVGTKRVPFTIAAAPTGPMLSDVVLVRRTEPGRADSDEPLQYDHDKIVPDLSRTANRDQKQISLFFSLQPDTKSQEKPKLELELSRNGKQVGRLPLTLQAQATAGVVPYIASLGVASLNKGEYQAQVILSQGAAVAKSNIDFTLEGADLATTASPSVQLGSAKENTAEESSVLAAPAPVPAELRHQQHKLLNFTSATHPSTPPDPKEKVAMLKIARDRALDYANSLPNLICVETTHRLVDPRGTGNWHQKDTFTELLRYRDKVEQRTTLAVNGSKSDTLREGLQGTVTVGEFGSLLSAIFDEDAKADFEWKETDALDAATVQVFAYHVDSANSHLSLTGGTLRIKTGYRGLVYLDTATGGVRRITMESADVPKDFPMQAAAFTLDYDYIAISGHDYLLPIGGTVTVRHGKRSYVLNEMEFRDYRRFGAESVLRFDDLK